MNGNLTITVEFGDGASHSRNIARFAAKFDTFLDQLTLSFDIPKNELSEDDRKAIRQFLDDVIKGTKPDVLRLKYIPKSAVERTFDSLADFFFHHFKTDACHFWINYSTWKDFWKKIQGLFLRNPAPKGFTKMVIWDHSETMTIYDLCQPEKKPGKQDDVPLLRLLQSEIRKETNTVFILEDIDAVLLSMDNHETTQDRAVLKNLLETNFFREKNNYLICVGNATAEIEIPVQLNGFWETFRDSSKDFPILESLGRNLTAQAITTKDIATLGREKEVRQLLEIFTKSKYNNALLVGRPGVGKTQIVKGLASRIVDKTDRDIPDKLRQIKIFEVEYTKLVKDTSVAGSLEARISNLIAEVRTHRNEVIIFFDEFHQFMANETIRNALKPALANGEFPAIGATTDYEFRRDVVGEDEALVQRFGRVNLDELPKETVKEIFKRMIDKNRDIKTLQIDDLTLEYLYWTSKRLNPLQALPRSGERVLSDVISRLNQSDESIITKRLIKERFKVGDISERLLNEKLFLEVGTNISSVIKGQDRQLKEILEKIRLHFSMLTKIERPLVLMIMGPTGVGKTELATLLARELWGDDGRALIFNMAGATDKSVITGAAPGYVGYEDSSPVLNFISSYDSGIIILDEIEKVTQSGNGRESQIQDAFLEVFDRGSTTDNRGRRINCRPFIFILTSNLGQDLTVDSSMEDRQRTLVGEGKCRPEFVGRIEQINVFSKVGEEVAREIIHSMLKQFNELPEFACKFNLDETAIENILQNANFVEFGVRHLKAVFENHMKRIVLSLQEKIDTPGDVTVNFENGKYNIIG
ncbi:MAG: ATP-dependent Clp protease ATP-binding subunit [Syntrophaceae bacterium]|nr:ATP-dependent Clp protease ATP-binding subunit [Syntrophaceae bacterium]